MSISEAADEAGTTLLNGIVDGSVDFRGKPSLRSTSGGWRSSGFIIGAEVAEKFAYLGIASNLITYFTGPLEMSTASAASNVNLWLGTAAFLPLIWGSIADSFLGRYRTILLTSSLYILGLGLLTFSATIPSLCKDQETLVSCVSKLKVTIFFSALYLIAIGEGGFKVCIRAFGADQFDEQDPKESKAKSVYFNWSYFARSAGILTTRLISNYVQENLSWALGFGIPCLSMMLSLFLFLLGTHTYRFSTGGEGRKHTNPFVRIGRVFVAAAKNRQQTSSETYLLVPTESSKTFRSRPIPKTMIILNEPMANVCDELEDSLHPGTTEGSMRSSSGGWKSARLIIGVEMAEHFAFYGISSNLITYLTGPLGESTAAAAANVNAWSGTVSFLPLLWGFIADSFLGRFRTILVASSLYILGHGQLSFSTMISSHHKDPSQLQVTLFFCSLYLIAIGHGGYKPCIRVFGADQLDGDALSSYFNWLMFGSCISVLTTRLISIFIQENLSWSLGFGIPSVSMLLSLLIFLLGTKNYRFSTARGEKKNPFARISHVFMEAVRNRGQPGLDIYNPNQTLLMVPVHDSKQLRFLDKAAISCDLAEIEEAKAVLKLAPIWMSCLVYAIVCAQSHTFFTKQGATMDRSISPGLLVPAATLQCFINLTMIIFIPIYDRLLVPIARSFTQCPSGITMLQRIGSGMVLSILAMVVAALVETKRLQTARDDATTLMCVWWLVPQYVFIGVADMLTMVGLQELFYDQVPCELRSIGMALNLSIYGVGNFLSSFMISFIDKVTRQSGQTSWFDNDLNKAHLDYFYWLLACLSSIGLASYLWFAKSYVYNRPNKF
ncbi:unnamed protein product [Brassica rapa subsp. narinosa]